MKHALEELELFFRDLRIRGVYPADPFRKSIGKECHDGLASTVAKHSSLRAVAAE